MTWIELFSAVLAARLISGLSLEWYREYQAVKNRKAATQVYSHALSQLKQTLNDAAYSDSSKVEPRN